MANNKFFLKDLQARAARVPGGRADQLLARGRIEGPHLVVDEKTLTEINQTFSTGTPPPEREFWRFNIAHLQSVARRKPPGYVEFIMTRGKVVGEFVVLDQASHKELREKFSPRKPAKQLNRPTLTELATNFTGAMTNWAQAGFKIVDEKEYEQRQTICLACSYWQPDAIFGVGQCRKCGCSGYKLWLATSRCPDNPPQW